MKKLLTFAVLGAMSVGMVGCRASAEVDPDSSSTSGSTDRTYKKTTTVQPDGDRTVKTETRTNTNP